MKFPFKDEDGAETDDKLPLRDDVMKFLMKVFSKNRISFETLDKIFFLVDYDLQFWVDDSFRYNTSPFSANPHTHFHKDGTINGRKWIQRRAKLPLVSMEHGITVFKNRNENIVLFPYSQYQNPILI